MAIEFNCPYCTATVRVGLDAAGKIGRCPKCDTRVRIPEIQPDAETATPPTVPPAPQSAGGFSELSQPQVSAQPTPLSVQGIPVIKTVETPVTSQYIKKKKKSGSWAPLIPPLLFGGLFVLIGFGYWLWSQPSFEGELIGKKLDPNQMIAVSIQGSLYNIPKQAFSELVDELRQRPSIVRSNLVNLRFEAGAGNALRIGLRPGIDSDLVSVPIYEHTAIQKYYDDHSIEWNEYRLAELQAALVALCNDWSKAAEAEKLKTLPDYRHTIAYNAFVKGLGRACEAVIMVEGTPTRYPCIHEDGSGSLSFLVPVGTTSFLIRIREGTNESYFPSKFQIRVNIPLPNTTPEVIVDTPVDPATIEPIPVDEAVLNKQTTEEPKPMNETEEPPQQ